MNYKIYDINIFERIFNNDVGVYTFNNNDFNNNYIYDKIKNIGVKPLSNIKNDDVKNYEYGWWINMNECKYDECSVKIRGKTFHFCWRNNENYNIQYYSLSPIFPVRNYLYKKP